MKTYLENVMADNDGGIIELIFIVAVVLISLIGQFLKGKMSGKDYVVASDDDKDGKYELKSMRGRPAESEYRLESEDVEEEPEEDKQDLMAELRARREILMQKARNIRRGDPARKTAPRQAPQQTDRPAQPQKAISASTRAQAELMRKRQEYMARLERARREKKAMAEREKAIRQRAEKQGRLNEVIKRQNFQTIPKVAVGKIENVTAKKPVSPGLSGVVHGIRNPQNLRAAIVYSEILSPPKGLREVDSHSFF